MASMTPSIEWIIKTRDKKLWYFARHLIVVMHCQLLTWALLLQYGDITIFIQSLTDIHEVYWMKKLNY
jgi:hypothetical protein